MRIVAKEASRVAMTSMLEFDDLFQEGFLAYDKAINGYDHCRKTLFTTYLTTVVRNRFNNLKKMHYLNREYSSEELPELIFRPSFIWELLAFDYSKQASIVVDLITKCSPMATQPSIMALKRHLNEVGYGNDKAIEETIVKAYRDLKGQHVVLMRHWERLNSYTLFKMKGVYDGNYKRTSYGNEEVCKRVEG